MPLLFLRVVVVGGLGQEQVGVEGHVDVVPDGKWQCQLMTSSSLMIKIKGISCRRSPRSVSPVCTLVGPC